MRKIKFRAWDKLNKEMINFESINFQERRVYKDTVSYRKFNDIELMQYTGLKDMKGKEIYEGDILFETFREEYFKVVFENGSFRVEVDEYSLDLEDYANICEVVGNIYENPELMEEKDEN
nr:MAG TPA: YopX protein [Caudoviricetes sp.]